MDGGRGFCKFSHKPASKTRKRQQLSSDLVVVSREKERERGIEKEEEDKEENRS
jgi:hypothetical protein